jgi:hypothetical protein
MPAFRLQDRLVRPAAKAFLLSAGLAVAAASAFAAKPATTGKPVVLEGELDVLVEDYADGRTRTRHVLKTEHGRVELKVRGKANHLRSGSKVRVRGEVQADVLALDAGNVEALTTATSSTMGQQDVAVILVNFQNDLGQPVTRDAARTMMFTTVDDFYQEASFGQTWLDGEVFGYYTIAMDDTVCDNYQLASLADQKATAAGVQLGNYARKVYVFPRNACGWSGLANVGGSATRAWINGGMSLLVVGHELGHNQGLSHAQSLNCDTSPLGNTCTTHSYGDTADIMGNYRAAHFSPFAKDVLGWLNDGVSPPIHTVSASGRYSIEPYSSQSVGPKAIRVPRGTDSSGRKLWYYLEYRQPVGADAVLGSTGNLTKGVIVRLATEGDIYSSRQLDMSPNSSTSSYGDLADGALALGQTYTDATAKVSITLASADAGGATVDVTYGGTTTPTCTRAKPVVTLAGPTTAVAAGSGLTYSVQVTNKDSSACPATTFTLARSVPSGWGGSLGAYSLALSPGASGSTTLRVTSPTTAAAGDFAIGVGTASTVGSTHTANASAIFTVAAGDSNTGDTGTLTESVGTDKATYSRGQTVYMSALVKRDGVAVKGASVSFRITQPNGSTTVLSATSATDGYARASYRLSKGKSAVGTYALRADATSSGDSATASAGFRVQ